MLKAQFEADMLNMSRDLEKLRRETVMWEMTKASQTGNEQVGERDYYDVIVGSHHCTPNIISLHW